jgi:hypothetical protein
VDCVSLTIFDSGRPSLLQGIAPVNVTTCVSGTAVMSPLRFNVETSVPYATCRSVVTYGT